MINAILLDMDGVLYHGDTPVNGARTFMEAIAKRPHAFITNNPILLPEQVADKLGGMGFRRPDPASIITSGVATARWLSEQTPGFRYFAMGAEGLHRALDGWGVADTRAPDYVVVGEGAGIDFEQLSLAINLVLRGARLIGTNPDNSVDATRDGKRWVLPGGGALIAPIVTATGITPTVIGKPEPLLYEIALRHLGVSAGECLMVGDRPDTDIAGAQRLGMKTALVRTGRFVPGEPWTDGQPRPDYDVRSLAELWVECFEG